MSAEALHVVQRLQEALAMEDIVGGFADPEVERHARSVFAEFAQPDFEVLMIGPDYLPSRVEERGIEGFLRAWGDWTDPFESYRIAPERMIEAGDQVVSIVRMRGTTKTGGVEIEAPAAAVWTVRDGRLARVEFHLDVDAAMRAAGLEP